MSRHRRTGSGRGGPLGTPGQLPDETPPGVPQEANEVVSGGGVAGPDDEEDPRPEPERTEPRPED